MLRMVELYLHFTILLHGAVLTYAQALLYLTLPLQYSAVIRLAGSPAIQLVF
jgi:hypothetical protein